MVYHGFSPLFDDNSKILVLGSFPSVKSREASFYYGHKQNRFWKILREFFCETAETVEEKKALCLKIGVALWDIVESCEIVGSMDADIKNYVLVNLEDVLSKCNIVKVLCNGQKSYDLAKSVYCGNVPLIRMPSTSPANFSFKKEIWFDELSLLKNL